MAKLDQKELLHLIAHKHDQQAFQWLVERYSLSLRSYALTFIKNPELAEEIVSDLWVNLWNRRTELEHIQYLSAYLFRATKNLALNYRLRIERSPIVTDQKSSSDILHSPTDESTPLLELEQKELRSILQQSIEQLPEGSRTAFLLIRERGLTYQEAANEMGISVNTLKTHLHRAVKKLRSHLATYLSSMISM